MPVSNSLPFLRVDRGMVLDLYYFLVGRSSPPEDGGPEGFGWFGVVVLYGRLLSNSSL